MKVRISQIRTKAARPNAPMIVKCSMVSFQASMVAVRGSRLRLHCGSPTKNVGLWPISGVLLEEAGQARVAGQVLVVQQQRGVVAEDLEERRRILVDDVAQPVAGLLGIAAFGLVGDRHRGRRTGGLGGGRGCGAPGAGPRPAAPP